MMGAENTNQLTTLQEIVILEQTRVNSLYHEVLCLSISVLCASCCYSAGCTREVRSCPKSESS